MEDLVEKNLSLEDQIILVLQQNEDLRVRIDNCQTFMQTTDTCTKTTKDGQLSKEQQDLK
ncbi:hypothetical protein KUCAC02_004142, partial [Chaenocephalus aceratus]